MTEADRPFDVSDGEWETALELGNLAGAICGGNTEALRFCLSLSDVALTFDHAWDGDPMDRGCTERAFMSLMLDWPLNRFVRDNAPILTSAMAAAISAWKSSDAMPEARVKAYDILSEVWSAVAFILGGWDRVNSVMPDVRRVLIKQKTLNDSKQKEI